ncbi:MAG UNVERIFIED_CONTAM: hypothetical protein LVR18_16550 [Planctomycetaceae bacterium]
MLETIGVVVLIVELVTILEGTSIDRDWLATIVTPSAPITACPVDHPQACRLHASSTPSSPANSRLSPRLRDSAAKKALKPATRPPSPSVPTTQEGVSPFAGFRRRNA